MGGDGNARRGWHVFSTDPAALLAALLAIFALVSAWNYGGSFEGDDFYLFWSVGQAAGGEEFGSVYTEEGRARVGDAFAARAELDGSARLRTLTRRHRVPMVAATPFYYALFGGLASGDYDHDLAVMRLLTLAGTVLFVLVAGRTLGYPLPAALLWIFALTVFFEPFRSCVRAGNVSQIQLGVLGLYLWTRQRALRHPRQVAWDMGSGALLGLAVMFKPNVGIAVLLLALAQLARGHLDRLRREALGAAGAVVVALVVGAVAFGTPRCWIDWIPVARGMMTDPPALDRGNYALANMLGEAMGGLDASLPVLAVLLALCGGLVWRVLRRAPRPDQNARTDLLMIGLGSAVAVLAAPLVWLHYYNLAVPLLLFGLRPPRVPPRSVFSWDVVRPVIAALAALCVAWWPLMLLTSDQSPRTAALLIGGGASALLVLALVDLQRDAPLSVE